MISTVVASIMKRTTRNNVFITALYTTKCLYNASQVSKKQQAMIIFVKLSSICENRTLSHNENGFRKVYPKPSYAFCGCTTGETHPSLSSLTLAGPPTRWHSGGQITHKFTMAVHQSTAEPRNPCTVCPSLPSLPSPRLSILLS